MMSDRQIEYRAVHSGDAPLQQRQISIADGPTWAASRRRGVAVDEEKLRRYHEAYRRDGQFLPYRQAYGEGWKAMKLHGMAALVTPGYLAGPVDWRTAKSVGVSSGSDGGSLTLTTR